MLSPNCHHEKSTVFVNQRQCFSLSKKQYSIFMLRAAARIQSNLLCKFINSGSMAQATLSCRYAAIHLVYLGIYTREEKMCPQDAVFLRDSLESVVSSERLFGKQSFSTVSSTVFVNQRQCLKNQVYDFGIFMVLSCAGRCRATSCRIFAFLIMVGMCARTVISCEAFGFAGRISLSLVSIVMR